MANVLGSEELSVRYGTTVGPTPALVQGGVACALFYVDPNGASTVRWFPKQNTVATHQGFPLRPGACISIAGEGAIRNSLFALDRDSDKAVFIYVLYFDRVDVIAADFIGDTSVKINATLKRMEEQLDDVILELKEQTEFLAEGIEA